MKVRIASAVGLLSLLALAACGSTGRSDGKDATAESRADAPAESRADALPESVDASLGQPDGQADAAASVDADAAPEAGTEAHADAPVDVDAGLGADAAVAETHGDADAAAEVNLDADAGAIEAHADADDLPDGEVAMCGADVPGLSPPTCTSGCSQCIWLFAGPDNVCSCRTGATFTACRAFLFCVSYAFYRCMANSPPWRPGSACKGDCATEIAALAGTTDGAEIDRQLDDPKTLLGMAARQGYAFFQNTANGCGPYCGCQAAP
jgi:hypothetical protein